MHFQNQLLSFIFMSLLLWNGSSVLHSSVQLSWLLKLTFSWVLGSWSVGWAGSSPRPLSCGLCCHLLTGHFPPVSSHCPSHRLHPLSTVLYGTPLDHLTPGPQNHWDVFLGLQVKIWSLSGLPGPSQVPFLPHLQSLSSVLSATLAVCGPPWILGQARHCIHKIPLNLQLYFW